MSTVNPQIHRFVRRALLEGRSDVAKEVNRAIKILGIPNDSQAFIERVQHTMKHGGKDQNPLYSKDLTERPLFLIFFFIAAFVVIGLLLSFLGSAMR
jgi:hypothetical protein